VYFSKNPNAAAIFMKGQMENPGAMLGLNYVISDYGVRINYGDKALK
jgi:hypothetical protein